MTAAIAIAATGVVLYVRNIAAERGRADAALHDARRERDRARLSEASQLLENDPNRAKALLASLTLRSPRYALLTGRMQQLSADKVVMVPSVVDALFRAPGSEAVELQTRDGGFHRLEPNSAQIETLDHDLAGPVAYRGGQWLYTRRTFGAGSVWIASPAQSNLFDVNLPSVSRLVALDDAVYALDGAHALHRFDGKTATVIDHDVRNIVGDGDTRLVCKLTGERVVTRKDAVVYRGRCPPAASPSTMAAVHDDYAALTADRVLIASRHGRQVEISNVQPSPDGRQVALDCKDGHVRVWMRDTASVAPVHAHIGAAVGVQWVKGRICSGGFADGHVVCSNPDGTDLRTLDSGTNRITRMTASPDHNFLVFAPSDGRVWRYDDRLEELYVHNSVSRLAISPDGRLLGSCSLDGSLAVYDLANHKLLAHVHDHVGRAANIAWVDDDLWTFGDDGTVKRWAVRNGSLTLRHTIEVNGRMHTVRAVRGLWVANTGDSVLVIGRDDESIALRLDLGRALDALDVSPDQRYVAAGVDGEIVVIDLQRNAVATMTVGSPRPKHLSFLDTATPCVQRERRAQDRRRRSSRIRPVPGDDRTVEQSRLASSLFIQRSEQSVGRWGTLEAPSRDANASSPWATASR
ncbi:MAG TPA: hypothetical protein VF488_05275, partial [Gemmatimonadaceae bacterium]